MPLSEPQNQHFKSRSAVYKTAQHILHIHTFFKMICFQPRRFYRGNTWVRWGVARFLAGRSACLCLVFCKFLVGAATFVVVALHPPCLWSELVLSLTHYIRFTSYTIYTRGCVDPVLTLHCYLSSERLMSYKDSNHEMKHKSRDIPELI